MTIRALTAALSLALSPVAARAATAGAPVAAPKPATGPAAEVKASSAPATPDMIYTAERLRDPFTAFVGGGGASGANASGKAFNKEDFNIHNLSLRGIMKDSSADYALFTDNGFGVAFILRRGKLYDGKNKPVRGVAGRLHLKQKTAELETADHDVQIFRLGEDEKE